MHDAIERYLKVGLIVAMADPCYATNPTRFIRKIACDSYFSVAEINPIADENHIVAVADLLKQSHMTVCYGAQGKLLSTGLNPNNIDENGRLEAEKILLAELDEAERLGAKTLAFLSGKWSVDTREEALVQLCKTTLAVCEKAKKKNMFVELEVFDFNIAKHALIGSAPLAAQFAAEIRKHCNNFGLMVDLSHIPMCYEEPDFVLRVLRPYITHFHVGNTVITNPTHEAYGDEHPRFGFANSENDTQQLLHFLTIMKQEGFFCKDNPHVLSIEVKPRSYEDADVVLANSKRVLNRAWALLED